MADVDKVKLPGGTVYDIDGGGGSSISPYTSNPAMNGTASPGSSNDYSRGDHVHPSDTSRVPTSRTINGHSLSGNVTLTASDVGALPDTYTAPVSSVNGQTGAVVLDANDVGALPDTYTAPVSSVNGQTGAVVLDANDVGALPDTTVIPTNTSDLNNDSGFITGITSGDVTTALGYTPYDSSNPSGYVDAAGAAAAAPIQSVNGQTGTVTLDASDVGALPDTYTAPVSSVNGQTGAVSLGAADVGALPDTTTIPANTSDLNNDSGFITSNSPALTGTPTAPTAAAGTDDTQIATTAFVNAAINTVVGMYSQTPNAVSVPSASNTTIANTGSLEANYHYIILAKASFAANTTGRRVMFLATSTSGSNIDRFAINSMMPVSGNNVATDMSMVYLCHPTAATTYYLRVYQNSGGALSVTGGLRVFKFKVGQ